MLHIQLKQTTSYTSILKLFKKDFVIGVFLLLGINEADPAPEQENGGSLMSTEEKAVGAVALKVYKAYWLAIGVCLAFTILLFVVLMQG